jgi:hypothetical protein
MILRNVSTRIVSLRDEAETVYTVPALGDLTVDDNLWGDDEFRRWLRYRVRDIVIVPATAVDPPITGDIDANARVGVRINSAGTTHKRRRMNLIPGTGIGITHADDSGNEEVDVTISSTTTTHASTHQAGQADALSGSLNATARVTVRKNTGADVGSRRRINVIEGSGITATVADDSGNEEIDLTLAANSIVRKDGTLIGTRPSINFTGIPVVADDAGNNRVNIAVNFTSAEADLGGDVPMTTANTWYDGPSVSLAAGTWFIVGTVTVAGAGGIDGITAKLWDGSTAESSACGDIESGGGQVSLTVSGIVAFGSTTTMKISATATTTGGTLKAFAPYNSAGGNASHIRAFKIA